jgi:hypothetical protein
MGEMLYRFYSGDHNPRLFASHQRERETFMDRTTIQPGDSRISHAGRLIRLPEHSFVGF